MNATNPAFPLRLKWRHIAIAIGIVLFALALRYLMLIEQAGTPESDFVPIGADPLNYFYRALGVLDGTYPTRAFDGLHPGVYYWFALLMALVGRTMTMLHLALAAVDAIAVGFMVACGWLLTKRASGGYLAGLLYAVYPPSIFYGTTFLSEGTAHVLLVLMLFLMLWQRDRARLWQSAGLGLIFGALFVTRGNLAPVAVIWVMWYWFQRTSVKDWFIHVTTAVLFSILVFSPFTWWNYQASGQLQLVTEPPGWQLYAANNRDSNGVGGRTMALNTNDTDYITAIWRDFAIAPDYMLGLLVRRVALHWSAHEPANTVYFEAFRDQSRVLQLVPLNFLHLSVLGLIGLMSLAFADRRLLGFFLLAIAWFTFMIAISFAISRLRYPIVSLLLLLASQGVIYWWQIWREKRIGQVWQAWIIPIVLISALLSLSFWIITPDPPMPPKRTYTQLPSEAIPIQITFAEGQLELVGWRAFPEWWTAPVDGWMTSTATYTIELFWRVPDNQQAQQPYQFSLFYVDDGMRYGGADYPIGAVSFPPRTAERWQMGQIYGEIISFELDDSLSPPLARSGQVRVGVWYWDEEGLIVNVPADNGEANLLIQYLAVFNPDIPPSLPTLPQLEQPIIFGDVIALHAYHLPTIATAGETITLSFHWSLLQNVSDDYRIFLHVVDETGSVVTQGDTRPVPSLLTYNWMRDYPLSADLPLTLPDITGTYQIYAGLYNDTGRLSTDQTDDRILLGTVAVFE
ncbi:MAG: hypothetical protein ACFE0Q_07895 [Anaerolineae bacterium]